MNGILKLFDYYGYQQTPPVPPDAGTMVVAGILTTIIGIIYTVVVAFAVVSYILQAISLFTIAKRRGIGKPWLAWIPGGDMWILGSISDQYQYLVKGRIRNRRKTLLVLTIALCATLIPLALSSTAMVVSAILGESLATVGGNAIAMHLCEIAMTAVAVVLTVFQYLAIYDLYASCQPGRAPLYLVLSIVVSATMPFFMFASRKKDLGMPPRKTETNPVAEIPTETACEETPVTEEAPVVEETPAAEETE